MPIHLSKNLKKKSDMNMFDFEFQIESLILNVFYNEVK